MASRTFHIQTFGCQMNERDSETLAGMLTEMGYSEEPARDEASIIIINTCSVREHADERFFGTLGQLKRVKAKRPDTLVCLCGCMMQQQHIIDRVETKFPWVDVIFGTHNIHNFPKLIKAVAEQKEHQVEVFPDGGEIVEGLPSKRKFRHKAFVNITFGCNNFCTYCIVPYTRGRERSRKASDIIAEIKRLAADGEKEVTLLGQNVNSYKGEEADGSICDFPDLLRMVEGVDGIERIRFMTSHPKDLSPKLINEFKENKKLCGHIHLPFQAGSDDVLKRMNRRYTSEQYLSLLESLREARPDIAVSTDIIVGFPGETEEDFEKTLELCEKAKFDSAFTFIYSVRKGTPAEKYEDQIPEDVKHERFGRLVDVINRSAAEKNAAMKGKVCDVLVEGKSKNGEGTMQGRTDGFKLVDFPADESLEGEIVKVEITEGKTFSLRGRLSE